MAWELPCMYHKNERKALNAKGHLHALPVKGRKGM